MDPVLVIGLGDKDQYPGYILNENGEIVEYNRMIDEKFAQENEVWALTINERVDENGKVSIDRIDAPQSNNLGRINAHMEFFRLAELKESYVSGKPDVYLKRFSLFDVRPGQSGNREIYKVGDETRGNQINVINRGDLSRTIPVNFTYYRNWDPVNGNVLGDVLIYVLYERDGVPTGERRVFITIEGRECFGSTQPLTCAQPKRVESITYRSADSYYDAGTIYFPLPIPFINPPRTACDYDGRDWGVRSWWTSICI